MGLEDEESNQMMEDNNSVTAGASVAPVVIQQPQIVQQPPFQPGSTPTHLMHRFMVCMENIRQSGGTCFY